VPKPPDQVTAQEAFAYAYGIGLSGRKPSAITIGARIACLSSFYRFLIRMDLVKSNPCDKLERPNVAPSPPRGLSADQVQQLLAVIPQTRVGLQDRAIILTLVLTGRRRAEVWGMKAGDLSVEGDRAYYTYRGRSGSAGVASHPSPRTWRYGPRWRRTGYPSLPFHQKRPCGCKRPVGTARG
jgi:site-specific recombinase XerD